MFRSYFGYVENSQFSNNYFENRPIKFTPCKTKHQNNKIRCCLKFLRNELGVTPGGHSYKMFDQMKTTTLLQSLSLSFINKVDKLKLS
jgi:hypothetical protein